VGEEGLLEEWMGARHSCAPAGRFFYPRVCLCTGKGFCARRFGAPLQGTPAAAPMRPATRTHVGCVPCGRTRPRWPGARPSSDRTLSTVCPRVWIEQGAGGWGNGTEPVCWIGVRGLRAGTVGRSAGVRACGSQCGCAYMLVGRSADVRARGSQCGCTRMLVGRSADVRARGPQTAPGKGRARGGRGHAELLVGARPSL
jgi:hypothetical protein